MSRDFNEYFEGYNVPGRLKNTAIAIMRRFSIYGLCDGMYICNVIANTSGIGNGLGVFTGDGITRIPRIAKELQCAYGCNIFEEDIEELEEILSNGVLDKGKATAGIEKYIEKCKEQKKLRQDWEADIFDRRIRDAKAELQSLLTE